MNRCGGIDPAERLVDETSYDSRVDESQSSYSTRMPIPDFGAGQMCGHSSADMDQGPSTSIYKDHLGTKDHDLIPDQDDPMDVMQGGPLETEVLANGNSVAAADSIEQSPEVSDESEINVDNRVVPSSSNKRPMRMVLGGVSD